MRCLLPKESIIFQSASASLSSKKTKYYLCISRYFDFLELSTYIKVTKKFGIKARQKDHESEILSASPLSERKSLVRNGIFLC